MGIGKLIKVERTISIYKKSRSKSLGESLEEININDIPLDQLKSIIKENPDDPFLYDGYLLTKKQITLLNDLIEHKINPDLKLFEYCLECYGIYE